jgi:hypothetical protein
LLLLLLLLVLLCDCRHDEETGLQLKLLLRKWVVRVATLRGGRNASRGASVSRWEVRRSCEELLIGAQQRERRVSGKLSTHHLPVLVLCRLHWLRVQVLLLVLVRGLKCRRLMLLRRLELRVKKVHSRRHGHSDRKRTAGLRWHTCAPAPGSRHGGADRQ